MPLRNGTPVHWRPSGVVDAVDGSNAHRGAMSALINLIPDSSTGGVYVPRPAAVLAADFGVGGFSTAGFISSLLVVGDIAYGTIATRRNPGNDEPFAYNLKTRAFLTVAGVTAANTPASPATSGDWTPPVVAQVGSRIIVTHPGFPGGAVKFGWFDISGGTFQPQGSTVSGSRYITGNPSVLGLQPGLTLTGSGIPANTIISRTFISYICFDVVGSTLAESERLNFTLPATDPGIPIAPGTLLNIVGPGIQPGTTLTAVNFGVMDMTLSLPATVTGSGTYTVFGDLSGSLGVLKGDTHSNTTVDNITYMAGLTVGQTVAATNIPSGTTISSINVAGKSIQLSAAATSTAAGTVLSINGAAIQLSNNATATADSVTFTAAGGTTAAPLWGAGDTDRNNLVAQPVGVAQFNGRAYFALGNLGIAYSDSLFPCRMSNTIAVQALTTNDGLAVTAVASLMLVTITGGIVQGIIAFQGASKMQQITGDQDIPATSTSIANGGSSTLTMNALPIATGTLAPNSIFSCNLGTGFVSPQGLRFIQFDGRVTEPIGDAGKGVTVPLINAVVPSRICAAANDDTVRITTQNGGVTGSPQQEWWYDLTRKEWSGPHTSAAGAISGWGSQNTFIMTLFGVNAQLWQSDAHAKTTSAFKENGVQLSCEADTVLLPDSGQMAMNAVIQSGLACAIAANAPLTVTALNPDGSVIDTITLDPPATWGQGVWGQFVWGGIVFQQRRLDWNKPLVMKQCSFRFSSTAAAGLRIGNLYMTYQKLGYNIEAAA